MRDCRIKLSKHKIRMNIFYENYNQIVLPISGVCEAITFSFCEKYSKKRTIIRAVIPFNKTFSPYWAGSQNVSKVSKITINAGAKITL